MKNFSKYKKLENVLSIESSFRSKIAERVTILNVKVLPKTLTLYMIPLDTEIFGFLIIFLDAIILKFNVSDEPPIMMIKRKYTAESSSGLSTSHSWPKTESKCCSRSSEREYSEMNVRRDQRDFQY